MEYTGKPKGGAGLGQGRKSKDSKAFSFRLDKESAQILERQPNQTKFVEDAIKKCG